MGLLKILRSISRALFEIDDSRRVNFAPGFYFQFPRQRVQIFAGLVDDGQSFEVSMSEASEILASVEAAYNSMSEQEVRLSGVLFRTDARAKPNHPEKVTIHLSGPSGKTVLRLHRAHIAAALHEYKSKMLS